MRKFHPLWCAVLLLLSVKGFGQVSSDNEAAKPKPPVHDFLLTFIVKEVDSDNKPTNSRSYTLLIADDRRHASLRANTKIRLVVGQEGPNAQYEYRDVGVNFDCDGAELKPEGLYIRVQSHVTSLTAVTASLVMPNRPAIRENQWDTVAVLVPGKPTRLFSSDDQEDKGRMEVEVTATQIH